MPVFTDFLEWCRSRQKGVTTVEYAIMLALVAVALGLSQTGIGDAIIGLFSQISSNLTN